MNRTEASTAMELPTESRHVYGAACTWHDREENAGKTKPRIIAGQSISLPCCPHCGSALLEMSADEWWALARKNDRSQPGYEDMLRWSQGKCFPDFDTLQNAYRQAKEE